MAALEEAVNNLRQAVNDAQSRFSVAGDVQAAVQAERDRYDALVAAENAEDAQQDQELVDAKAETDRLLGEINSAAESLTAVTDQVNSLGQVTSTDQPAADATAPAADQPAPDAATPENSASPAAEPATPVDTGAAESQVADEPAPGPSAVDNAATDEATSSDPTDISNLRPNI